MNAKDAILRVYGTADSVLNRYISDLTDADLLVRPGPGQNHIAWQLGHLIGAERYFVELMKPGTSPPLPEGFEQVYGRDEASTASEDPKRFLSKGTYLGLYKTQREATLRYLNSLSESDLDAPGPERTRQMAPTVGSVLVLIGTHVLMHTGQWVSVRRKLKKPIVI
jgi:hypothetical protein